MLYRNRESPLPKASLLSLAGRFFAGWARGRQRHLTQIDLMSINPRLKADLGLRDSDLHDYMHP